MGTPSDVSGAGLPAISPPAYKTPIPSLLQQWAGDNFTPGRQYLHTFIKDTYYNNLNCEWRFQAPDGQMVQLEAQGNVDVHCGDDAGDGDVLTMHSLLRDGNAVGSSFFSQRCARGPYAVRQPTPSGAARSEDRGQTVAGVVLRFSTDDKIRRRGFHFIAFTGE